MLYLNHDFYSNFNSSIASGDNEFISDMLINELSELIVYKRDDLLEFLQKVGIKINSSSSDKKVVNIILDEMPNNIKLRKGLAFMIAQNNVNEKKPIDKKTMIKQIDMVASGIIGINDSFNYKPQLKKEFKNKLLKAIKTKDKIVGDRKIPGKNKDGLILLAISVIIAGGLILYFRNKKKSQLTTTQMPIEGIETPSTQIEEPIIPESLVKKLEV